MASATEPILDYSPETLNTLLSKSTLLPAARAVLLLRMCQFAQIFQQELLNKYWIQLKGVAQHLPKTYLEAFGGLKATIEPTPPTEHHGFTQQFIAAIEHATKLAATDREAACRSFQQCSEQLNRRWWPFGKRDLWNALLIAWAEIDRKIPLQLIGYSSPAAQENLLTRWNLKEPFSYEEWLGVDGSAHEAAIRAALAVLEKKDEPVLQLPVRLRDELAQRILQDVHPASSTEQNWQVKAQRRKGIQLYLKLIKCAAKESAQAGASVLQAAYSATIATKYFGDGWAERFSSLQLWLSVWAGFPQLRDSAMAALEQTPPYLRDFAFAQWYASIPANEAEILSAWDALNTKCSDLATSQGWFLVTLVGRGFGKQAMELTRSSSQPASLIAQLRRAWLIEHAETAHDGVAAEELENDLVGQFLHKPSTSERADFLRGLTKNGEEPLPKEFWSTFTNFILAVTSHKEIAGVGPNWYMKTTPQSEQFKECLRVNGHGNYLFEDVDPFLMAALIPWDAAHSEEAKRVFEFMWNEIRPSDSDLFLDLWRTGVFERCQSVLAASPQAFERLFVRWVKQKMVDQPLREQRGNMIYTFSLKDTAPFLFCLLGAQKLGPHSARRCDELLEMALANYRADEELMAATAELYTIGRGLKALDWTLPKKNQQYASDWQVGIIEASSKEILAAFLGKQQERQAA